MRVAEMTKDAIYGLPHLEFYAEEFSAMIILPHEAGDTEGLHESGYRCMAFCLEDKGEPLGIINGWSDALFPRGAIENRSDMSLLDPDSSLPGTGGRPFPWKIDCLPTSGLLRLHCSPFPLRILDVSSSLEVFVSVDRRYLRTARKVAGRDAGR